MYGKATLWERFSTTAFLLSLKGVSERIFEFVDAVEKICRLVTPTRTPNTFILFHSFLWNNFFFSHQLQIYLYNIDNFIFP